MNSEIAVCDDCGRVIAREYKGNLPAPVETSMYCLDCGQLSSRYHIETVDDLPPIIGEKYKDS